MYYPRYVGLIIARDNSSRVFSNGVPFDYAKHGGLYNESVVDMPEDCPYPVLDPEFRDKLQVDSSYGCNGMMELYTCFHPNLQAEPGAVSSQGGNGISLNFVVGGAAFLVAALVCAVCFAVKLKRQNEALKQKVQNCDDA